MKGGGRTRNGRFTLKGWHIAFTTLIVLVTLISLYLALYKNQIERRVQVLRAAGYPTTFVELAEYTKLPDGVENAAGVYMSALAAFVPPADEVNVPIVGKAKWPDQGAPLPPPTAESITACLAANQKCLALLHKAASMEHCRYDYDYDAQLESAPQAIGLKCCAQLLCLAAIYDAYQGATSAVLTHIKDGLRLGDSLQGEPALLSYSLRIAFTGVALGGLERALCLVSFADQQLKQLDEALTRTVRTLDLTRVLVTERCRLIEMCRDPSFFAGPVWGNVPGFRSMWLTETLDDVEARIKACDLPVPDRWNRFREIRDEIERRSFLHMMSYITNSSTARVLDLDALVRTHVDIARTALAIERYRLASGQVPERLAELVPQYLECVPIDPFDGQPIRYQRKNPGYLLYSVDLDGQDNGGRTRDDKSRDGPPDLCFMVTR